MQRRPGAQSMKSPAPTVAAVVREQTGVSWSRARKLCSEGRVTVDGKRCLDPAARILADSPALLQLRTVATAAQGSAQLVVHLGGPGPVVDRGDPGHAVIIGVSGESDAPSGRE